MELQEGNAFERSSGYVSFRIWVRVDALMHARQPSNLRKNKPPQEKKTHKESLQKAKTLNPHPTIFKVSLPTISMDQFIQFIDHWKLLGSGFEVLLLPLEWG